MEMKTVQQFTIPQFIDVEDKIFGPITTRQFVICLAGAMLIFLTFRLADFALFVTISLIIFFICITFAFVKVNGRPFHYFSLNFVQTMRRPALRVWNHTLQMSEIDPSEGLKPAEAPLAAPKRMTSSRLAELSLIVDTSGEFKGEDNGEEMKRA